MEVVNGQITIQQMQHRGVGLEQLIDIHTYDAIITVFMWFFWSSDQYKKTKKQKKQTDHFSKETHL
jgi:preprotein translocase subunit YajC